jgi:hypothetical protein
MKCAPQQPAWSWQTARDEQQAVLPSESELDASARGLARDCSAASTACTL